jgi:hypothetical protein
MPGELVAAFLDAGRPVLAIDVYLTGEAEFLTAVLDKNRQDKKFFSTYNRMPLVERVQDILTALAYLKGRRGATRVNLVGVGKAGMWCLLAAPSSPQGTRFVADLGRLSGDGDPRWLHDLFTPCILKAGGISTAVALAAPRPIFIHNVAEGFDAKPLRAGYRAGKGASGLRIQRRAADAGTIMNWVARK